jgi:hypothetical protein
LSRQAPGPTFDAWEALGKDPRSRTNPRRQHPLRGRLATHMVGGRSLEQWQYEVTGAGRIWYCIDDKVRTVWLTAATTDHPRETE